MPNISTPDTNALRRLLLQQVAAQTTLEYKQAADALGLKSPGQIQQIAALLEACQEDDALLARPQLAALVVQKSQAPYPRPGFFQKLKQLDVYQGPEQGPEAQMWHQNELERVFDFYRQTSAKD